MTRGKYLSLGGLDQVIDVDVKVIVIFDIVDGGLGWDLVDHQAGPLHPLVSHVLHLLTHKALCLFPRLTVSWEQVLVL